MPNHITTTIHMNGNQNDLNTLRRLVDTEEHPSPNTTDPTAFDFQAIVPRPADQESNWYDWNCENWGTKWNSYEGSWSDDNTCVSFQTAWAMPEAVIKTLSKKFPGITFVIGYADEDSGSNCGILIIKNGEEMWIDADGWSKDANMPKPIALAFARTIHGDEVESIEDWADEQGYDSVAKAKEDYKGDDYFEFLRSSFIVKHPILKLANLIANGNIKAIMKCLNQITTVKHLQLENHKHLIEG